MRCATTRRPSATTTSATASATLSRAIKEASFPVARRRTRISRTEPRAYPAYVIVRRGDVRVGIVGATTPGAMVWERDNLRGTRRDPRHRAGGADRGCRGASEGRGRRRRHDALGISRASSGYDTVSTGVASENVAARVAREVPGVDLDRLRSLAPGVAGHRDRRRRDCCSPRTGRRALVSRTLVLERTRRQWRVARSSGTTVQSVGHAESAAVRRRRSRARTRRPSRT